MLHYHIPLLYEHCSAATTPDAAIAAEILQGFGYKAVALLVQWMYSSPTDAYSGPSGENGETASQKLLVQSWVLGKVLEVAGLQIDALDALDRRIKLDQSLGLENSRWLWNNISKDDELREYFMQSCVEEYSTLESEISKCAPVEMKQIIEEKVSWLREWSGI